VCAAAPASLWREALRAWSSAHLEKAREFAEDRRTLQRSKILTALLERWAKFIAIRQDFFGAHEIPATAGRHERRLKFSTDARIIFALFRMFRGPCFLRLRNFFAHESR
jgi:hypothetical protein